MADNNSITGSVVGKIRFNIDKKSWDNLELFQKKLTSIKKQMTGMDKTIKVQATIQAIDKIATATVKAEQKIDKVKAEVAKKQRKRDNMNAHVQEHNYRKAIEKQHEKALKMNEAIDKERAKLNSTASGRTKVKRGFDTNTSHVELFRQNNRDHAEALKLNKKFDNQRSVAQRKANIESQRSINRQSSFDESVAAFRVIKEQQIKTTAMSRGWSPEKQREALISMNKVMDEWYTKSNGSIKMFRAQSNDFIRTLQVGDAVARKNALSFRSMRQELVQLTAAYTAFSLAQNVAQTGFEFESLRASARVFAKDDAGVANHMAFIAEQAQRLGIDLATATKEFTKFSIATQSSMSKVDQRNLFVSMSEYSRVLGLNKQDYERAFRAVQQIECCLPIQ